MTYFVHCWRGVPANLRDDEPEIFCCVEYGEEAWPSYSYLFIH